MKKCFNGRGFTRVELMVVVAILSVLMTAGLMAYSSFTEKARKVRALAQINKIQLAIDNLALDTEAWPGPNPVGELASKEVWDLNSGAAGLVQASNKFNNWNGPYIDAIPKDPWGSDYFFDPDYRIKTQRFVVIGSFGPNKTGKNREDGDNIVVILSAF
jgi:type II secretion system protein G